MTNAFSLRTNLRTLIVPPPGTLRSLDGMRGILCLWVISFHALFLLGLFLPPNAYQALARDRGLLVVEHGALAMEGFFVLSGFLIGSLLLREVRRGTIDLRRFYTRRALRILPVYYVVLALYAWTHGPNASAIWANLLFVNNFLPFQRQALSWTWSVAIEEQFYLVCPLFVLLLARLPARHQLRVLIALFVLAVGISNEVTFVHGFTLSSVGARAVERFDVFHDKPYTRVGPLLLGVVAAWLHTHTSVLSKLARYRVQSALAAALALAAIVLLVLFPASDEALAAWNVKGFLRPAGELYTANSGFVYAIASAYLLLLSLSEHAFGRISSWLLDNRPLHAIAQLSYPAYLCHPIIFFLIYEVKSPRDTLGIAGFAEYVALGVVLSFAIALVLHLLIERPAMNLRPRSRVERS